MDRKTYSKCVGDALRGKKFTPQQRKKEFCVASKLCSQKASSHAEAEQMCEISMSQPKPVSDKVIRKTRGKGKSDEKQLLELAQCMAENINMDQASNINSIETALLNAMLECQK